MIPAALLIVLQLSGPCAGVPAPAPIVDVVFEPNAPKYAGPACSEEEAGLCVTPPDWDDREVSAEGTARYVFEYVGELKVRDDWSGSDVLAMRPADPPACWAWSWSPLK